MTTKLTSASHTDGARLFSLLAGVYCGAKMLLLAAYTVHTQYVMDEYWQGGESFHIPEFYRAYDPVKTVLYTFYYQLARLASTTSNGLMTGTRLLTLAAVVAMLILLVRTWRRLGFAAHEALFALCVLLAYSNFMEHSFRVRSDSIALFFDVAAVAIVCGGEFGHPRRTLLSGALVGLAFLCTQKAVYAAFSLGVALAVVLLFSAGIRRTAAAGAACLGGFAATLAVYAAGFQWRGRINVLRSVFTRPLDLVQHGTHYYPDMNRYVWQTLGRNWLPYVLCGAGMLLAARKWNRSTLQQRFALVFSAVFAACIFLHNQPWPYVFVSAIVFLAPWSVETLRELEARSGGLRASAGFVLLALLAFSFPRNLRYLQKDNVIQEAVSAQAESLLSPGDVYEDGAGMITTRRLGGPMWWDGMGIARIFEEAGRGDFTQVDLAFRARPKVWIWNYRIAALAPIIGRALTQSYVRVERNVLLTGGELNAADRLFVVRWPGVYALYGGGGRIPGNVILDGRVVATPMMLGSGPHSVRLAASPASPLFILPADLPNRPVERVTAPPLDLYEAVYE